VHDLHFKATYIKSSRVDIRILHWSEHQMLDAREGIWPRVWYHTGPRRDMWRREKPQPNPFGKQYNHHELSYRSHPFGEQYNHH